MVLKMANRLVKHRKPDKASKNFKEASPAASNSSAKTETRDSLHPPTASTPPRHPIEPRLPRASPLAQNDRSQSMTQAKTHSLTTPRKHATESPSPSPSLASPATNKLGGTPKMLSTIRTVPSFEGVPSDTSSDGTSTSPKNSAFSSSVNSRMSAISMASHDNEDDKMPTVRLKVEQQPKAWGDGSANGYTVLAQEQRHAANHRQQQPRQPQETKGSLPSEPTESDGRNPPTSTAPDGQGQAWDSTIGKAGLGKTGRVINKLVGDNEALKRDIQIERLKADEARQAAKLTEDKMERLIQDYESRLLEASVTKTLLARKERQVESLTASVELERRKAAAALDRERTWREEMERAQHDAKIRVEDAGAHAQLMEGRYNAIASHWRDQGDEVRRATGKIRGEIDALVEERRKDDEKIVTLQELCDQQDSSIRELIRQKEDIGCKFEAYKAEQEDWLRDVKLNARAREEEQERLLEETRETLAKLKWALNVKENVRGAQ